MSKTPLSQLHMLAARKEYHVYSDGSNIMLEPKQSGDRQSYPFTDEGIQEAIAWLETVEQNPPAK